MKEGSQDASCSDSGRQPNVSLRRTRPAAARQRQTAGDRSIRTPTSRENSVFKGQILCSELTLSCYLQSRVSGLMYPERWKKTALSLLLKACAKAGMASPCDATWGTCRTVPEVWLVLFTRNDF